MLEMNYTEQQLTAAVVSEGLRPVLAGPDLSAPASLVSLISRCWDADPQSRASFDDIVMELDSIMEHEIGVSNGENASAKSSISQGVPQGINPQGYQESINWNTQGEDFAKTVSLTPNSCVRTWNDSANDSSVYSPVLSWGSFASCGRRETMEDRHFVMPNMCDTQDIHFFGIFDGHRGKLHSNIKFLGSNEQKMKLRWNFSWNEGKIFDHDINIRFRLSSRLWLSLHLILPF